MSSESLHVGEQSATLFCAWSWQALELAAAVVAGKQGGTTRGVSARFGPRWKAKLPPVSA